MSSFDFDLIVIGGGSGGVSSAKRAALSYGKKVAIIEGARFGGTCVNVGCVPKKIWFQAAHIYETVNHDAKHYRIETGAIPAKFDWKDLKGKRDKYIERLNGIYSSGLAKAGVTIIEGWASFASNDPHTITINTNDGQTFTKTADKIVIAVGGKPQVPGGEGVAEYSITSDGFFELETQPQKAVVVGAGYIAVELAGVLAALGTDTHLVLRKEKALRTFDPEISDFLDNLMSNHTPNMTVHRNTSGVAKIEAVGDKKTVTTVSGKVIDGADIVLMAPGRIANTDTLGLDKVGIQTNERKPDQILVDEFQVTSVPNIFALGDVCGQVELTPMAIAAGRRLADRLFSDNPTYKYAKASYENVPTVVFSHPTIGTIGMTEPEAIQKYGQENLQIYKSTFVNLYYSMFDLEPADKPKTFMKIICAGIEEQVVGIHMIGMAADEMLQGFGVAMKMGCTKADLDACIAIHPTAAEEMVTMGTWGTSPPYSGAKVPQILGASAGEPTLKKATT